MEYNLNKLSLKYQLKTFRWAFNGLSVFFRQEIKATLHTLAAILVILLGFILKLELIGWIGVILSICLVFITELFNTIIERLADTLPDKHDSTRGTIKDIAAGAVLFASIAAFTIGLLVFIPKIKELWLLL
jgi:diacylglycerol kinase (ATP)